MDLNKELGEIRVINLRHRSDRMERVNKEFEKLGVGPVVRFDAVKNVQGYIGCMLSHIALLERCKDVHRFSIFEDDVEFLGTREQLLEAMSQLPDNWDMLYLGAYQHSKPISLKPNLIRLQNSFCAHAIIFNNFRIVQYIMDNIDLVYKHQKIDVFYANVIQPKFNVYCVSPIFATQFNSHSDITGRTNNYRDMIVENFKNMTQNLM